MKMKKIIAMICILAIATGIVSGCSKSKDKETSSGTTKTNYSADLTKKLKFTMNVLDTDKNGKDERYKYLTDKFNVEFEFVACSLNDIQEKTRIWVASGDMPDVMWMDFKLNQSNELKKWVESGSFTALPEFKGKYPNLAKAQETMKSSEYLKVDGKSYLLQAQRGLEKFKNITPQGFFYRKDWAEKLGMAKDEYTWDEFIALGKAFTQKNPGGNGAGKTVGLAGVGWSFPNFAGLQQIAPFWNGFQLKDGKYVWGPSQPETLEAVKMVKKLNDEGILWSEHAMAKTSDGPNKYSAGQVGILYHNWNLNNITNIRKGIQKAFPAVDVDKAVAPMVVKSPNSKVFALQSEDYYGAVALNSKLSDEKVTRLLSMWDWLASDEGYKLQTLGVQGKDWDMKDGQPSMLWTKDDQGNYKSPYEPGSDRFLSVIRLLDGFAYDSPLEAKAAKDTGNKQMNRYTKSDVEIFKVDYALATFSAPNKDKYSTLADEAKDKIIQMMINSNDIAKDWKNWTDSNQPKVKLILDEMNKK